jgi:hypothetical protein
VIGAPLLEVLFRRGKRKEDHCEPVHRQVLEQ